MAVRGKRGPVTGLGGDGDSGNPVFTPDVTDAIIASAKAERRKPKTEKLREDSGTPVKPVVVSSYVPSGNVAPNIEYGTAMEELDIAGELAKIEEERRLSMGASVPVDGEVVEDLPPVVKLPLPPVRNMQNPREFFAYWASIPRNLQDRLIGYVYRKFPVINKYWCPQCEQTIVPAAKGNRGKPSLCTNCNWVGVIHTHIDKLVAPIEPRDVLQLYGTGHYMFMLVDTERGGGILCTTTVITETDYRTYPPAITDKRDVVKDDPSNRAYVEYLRANHVALRGEKQEREEDEDMANGGIVETLVSKVIQMSDSQQQRLERGRQLRERRNRAGGGKSESVAMNEMAAMMSKTAQAANQFVLDTARRTQDMAGDPIETIKTVAALVKDLGGGGGRDSSSVVEIMKTFMEREAQSNRAVLELYQSQTKNVMEELKILKAQQSAPPPPKGIRETLQEMRDFKDLIRDISGNGDDDGGGRNSGGFDWAGLVAQVLPSVINGVIAVSHNMAIVAQAGKGVADGQASVVGAPIGPTPAQTPATQPAPAPAPAMGQQNGQEGQDEDMNLKLVAYQQLFAKMEPRLVASLEMEDEPDAGFIFAEEMVGWHGPDPYNAVKSMGLETLSGVLMQWGGPRLKEIALTKPAHFNTFLTQFLTAFDDDGADAEQGTPVTPVTGITGGGGTT